MRKRVGGRQLGRTSGERISLYRNLMASLVHHEKIRTTEAKAKEIRPQIEKMISLATVDTPHHRRLALAKLPQPVAVAKLFDIIGPRYVDRPGGYTRIYRLGHRKGDGAPVVQIELVEAE